MYQLHFQAHFYYSLHHFLTPLAQKLCSVQLSFILKWCCFPYALPTSLITHLNSVALRVLSLIKIKRDIYLSTLLLGSSKKSNHSFVVNLLKKKKDSSMAMFSTPRVWDNGVSTYCEGDEVYLVNLLDRCRLFLKFANSAVFLFR